MINQSAGRLAYHLRRYDDLFPRDDPVNLVPAKTHTPGGRVDVTAIEIATAQEVYAHVDVQVS